MSRYLDPIRRVNADRRARLAQPDAPAGPSLTDWWMSGESPIADERGRGGGQPVARDLGDFAGRVFQGLAMMGPVGLVTGLARSSENARNAQDAINSMNVAGGVLNPELAGRNNSGPAVGGEADMWSGKDLDLAGSIGESPGLYFEGGIVDEPLLPGDPPGPDNRIIGAMKDEVMIPPSKYRRLSKETRAEIERLFKERRPIGKAKK